MNKRLPIIIQILFVAVGLFAAVQLVRSASVTVNVLFFARFTDTWFLGTFPSLVLLALCLLGFAASVWFTRPKTKFPPYFLFRRFDFSVVLVFCGTGIFVCFTMLREAIFAAPAIRAGDFTVSVDWAHTDWRFFLPLIAYFLGLVAIGEFVARLRDKTLVPTLYWLAFFRHYRFLHVKILAAALLAGQIYLLVTYFFTPVRVFVLFGFAALTYFAAFLLNLSKEYDLANAEKIRAERFKAELITSVSHDIKTPLTSLINYVDLLKNAGLDGQAADYVEVLDKKSARLKTLIDDLMDASKAGTGNVRLEMQELDFVELLGQVAGEFEDAFAKKNLTLVLRTEDAAATIRTDSRHLYRVLENLFSNAAKYALGGTRVFADLATRDGKTHFTLQNTSETPIDFSDGEATEQFMRGDKSRKTEGSGLGLYIAKNLVELMCGELRVHTVGDLFRVDISMG